MFKGHLNEVKVIISVLVVIFGGIVAFAQSTPPPSTPPAPAKSPSVTEPPRVPALKVPPSSKKDKTPTPTVTSAGMSEEKPTSEELHREAGAKQVTEAAVKDAVQDFRELLSMQAKLFYNYSPTALYEVFCKEGNITDIQLQAGEEPLYVGGGDTLRWMIDKAQSGAGDQKQWHIYVKPLKSRISTNIIITTDRHSYQIRVRAANFYNPVVGWVYPAEEKAAFMRIMATEKKKADETIATATSPNLLNFNYTIESQSAWYQYRYSWTPKMVFDDGLKTYLQMPPTMKSNEAPALFIKNEDGEVNLVNYRVKDNYYIVDRLFVQAELRCGLKEIVIISKLKGK